MYIYYGVHDLLFEVVVFNSAVEILCIPHGISLVLMVRGRKERKRNKGPSIAPVIARCNRTKD